jgi:hypothetical protein
MSRHRTACAMLFGAMLMGATLALAGCAQKLVYLLPDGRAPAADPALSRQFALDSATCNDERAKSVQGGDHGDGSSSRGREVDQVGDQCMEEKGYVSVQQDQMAAKQQELAAAAARAQSNAPAPPKRN